MAVDYAAALNFVFPIMVIIIGGACILLYGVTSTLRTSNGDLRDRVADLEANEKRLESANATLTAEVAALQRVVTGEVQLAAISDHLDAFHRETVESTAQIKHGVDLLVLKANG